jgi:xanthine/uracil permease
MNDWAGSRTVGIGAQHVVAMFGATFIVPVLTGFPLATTLLSDRQHHRDTGPVP